MIPCSTASCPGSGAFCGFLTSRLGHCGGLEGENDSENAPCHPRIGPHLAQVGSFDANNPAPEPHNPGSLQHSLFCRVLAALDLLVWVGLAVFEWGERPSSPHMTWWCRQTIGQPLAAIRSDSDVNGRVNHAFLPSRPHKALAMQQVVIAVVSVLKALQACMQSHKPGCADAVPIIAITPLSCIHSHCTGACHAIRSTAGCP